MQKVFCVLAVAFFLFPAFAGATTFNDVPVVDANCAAKVAPAPDSHARACALRCAASGFGIITSDHKFLKFDAAGNQEIIAQLKASTEKNHLRVNVSGEIQGDTLKVKSVKLL